MAISEMMKSIPVAGPVAGEISGALIDAISSGDIMGVRFEEGRSRNEVVSNLENIITSHKGY